MFEVLDLLERKRLREILAEYLGERPALSVKKCTLRRVPVDTGTDWHQDGAFLGPDIRTVNVWLALTDCGERRSRTRPRAETTRTARDGNRGRAVRLVGRAGRGGTGRDRRGVVRPLFEAGDALLFDDRHLHRTGVSPGMTIERYAIETWFFAPSRYPHPQVPIVF